VYAMGNGSSSMPQCLHPSRINSGHRKAAAKNKTVAMTIRPFCPAPLFVLTVLSIISLPLSTMAQPGWDINYIDMKLNFEANSTQELVFMYNISSTREYEYELFEKDCSTKIVGNLITSNRSSTSTEHNSDLDDLSLFYDIDQSAISSSPIWNQTSQEMVMCLVVSLISNEDVGKFIIAQDKHVITVGINSTVNFSFDNAFQYSAAGNASSTADLYDYVEACKCTEDETFVCDSSPLAPNEVFHVCVKSSSPDVRIRDVTQMNIGQDDESLAVIQGGNIKYSSFSSKIPHSDQNGYKINVLLPINLFNFSGSNVTVDGTLKMQLGQPEEESRFLRKLASENGLEAASFMLQIALTDTPTDLKINDAAEVDSTPPGFLVPVLAVVGSFSLLGMAGMALKLAKHGFGSGNLLFQKLQLCKE